jgi:hypothetical protein
MECDPIGNRPDDTERSSLIRSSIRSGRFAIAQQFGLKGAF